MIIFGVIFLCIVSYLLGSFPSGYVIARLVRRLDIRKLGSKSTGATNTSRVLGFHFGLLVLFLDALKGIIILIILVTFKIEKLYMVNLFFEDKINILFIYGICAILGHIHPLFISFKGGKAVATSFGVALFFTPILALVGVLILIIITLLTRYVSFGSLLATFSVFLITLILAILKVNVMPYMATPMLNIIPLEYALGYGIMVLIIFIKHKDNVVRLFKGQENKFKFKKI